MDYQTLSTIKNKNVQQQNQLTFLEIRRTAKAIKQNPILYPWLIEVLSTKQLDINDGILIEYHEIPEQNGLQCMVTWLTNDKRFHYIDVVADYKNHELIDIEEFKEFYPEITAHNKGTGKSFGYLALNVLRSFMRSNL